MLIIYLSHSNSVSKKITLIFRKLLNLFGSRLQPMKVGHITSAIVKSDTLLACEMLILVFVLHGLSGKLLTKFYSFWFAKYFVLVHTSNFVEV